MNDLHAIMNRFNDGMISHGEAMHGVELLAIQLMDARVYIINSLMKNEAAEGERRLKEAGVIT